MKSKDLSIYIENYLKNDKTGRALMLTGHWGIGKSYYINNELISQLDRENCLIVSLYGLNTLNDVNKSLYVESKLNLIRGQCFFKLIKEWRLSKWIAKFEIWKWFKKKKKIASKACIFSKTLIKGILSYKSIDLSISDKDLSKLLKCTDYNGKLIIFEDLERSNIDIIEIMGFVNNLVEQDGVKILIVANEEEICKENGQLVKYNKIKEKTISDTIIFECEVEEAVLGIMKIFFSEQNFYNKNLQKIVQNENIKNTISMLAKDNVSLRKFMLACQKTNDIFRNIIKVNINFWGSVLKRNLEFILHDEGSKIVCSFDDSDSPSGTFTYSDYLQEICCECIVYHRVNKNRIKFLMNDFAKQEKVKLQKDFIYQNINKISEFQWYSEMEVVSSATKISEYLDTNDIDIKEYRKLARAIIQLKTFVNDEIIEECKEKMIKNVMEYNFSNIPYGQWRFNPGGTIIRNKEIGEEFDSFMLKMNNIIQKQNFEIPEKLYEIQNFDEFNKFVKSSENYFLLTRSFLLNFKISLLINLIRKCDSLRLNELMWLFAPFFERYNNSNYKCDIPNLKRLRNELDELIEKGTNRDKIYIFNLKNFLREIEKAIEKL